MSKHTPGPWRWEVNEKHKSMQLVGGVPKYDLTIMDFERWGMHGAAPMLRETEEDGMNIMRRCTVFAVPVAGREHHAHWFKTIDHPDARLMASAPDLLEALEMLLDADENAEGYGTAGVTEDIRDKARAAIAKARGN